VERNLDLCLLSIIMFNGRDEGLMLMMKIVGLW